MSRALAGPTFGNLQVDGKGAAGSQPKSLISHRQNTKGS